MRRMCIFVLLTMLLFAACQPTPEEEIIPNKKDDPMAQVIAENGEGFSIEAYRARLPERWQELLEMGNGAATITVDAKISFPEADRLPIQQIVPVGIDLDAVETLVEKLVPGGYLSFIPVDEFGIAVWTRQRIQAEMEQNQWRMEHARELHPEDSERELQIYRQDLEKANQELMEAYRQASDEDPVPLDSLDELRAEDFQGELGLFDSTGRRLGEMTLIFDGTGRQREQVHLRSVTGGIGARVGVDQAEALAWAKGLIKVMGYEDRYALIGAQESAATLTLTFGPAVQGVDYAFGCEPETEYSWASFAPEETMEMTFDKESGALAVLSWVGRSEALREVSENITLLPFDRVQTLVKNGLTFLMSWTNENVRSRSVHIQELRLGYKRIQTPNAQGWLMVPVWLVSGSVIDRGFSMDLDTGEVDDFENEVVKGPLLILNAADGTLIGTVTID